MYKGGAEDHWSWSPPAMGLNPWLAPYQLFDFQQSLNVTETHLKNDNSNTYFVGVYFSD